MRIHHGWKAALFGLCGPLFLGISRGDTTLAAEGPIMELPPATVKAKSRPAPAARPPRSGLDHRLKAADLARSVSTFGDPSRVVQTLPGAGRTNDWQNTLVVRGGEPNQTVMLVDGTPISRTSHYEGDRNERGGIGILNLEFAESLAFHKGPFPAHMPDRLSGVVELDYRDGDTAAYRNRVVTDVTGVGGAVEGPLALGQRRGSFASVFRYSALDLLVRSKVVDAVGAPRFFNGQVRMFLPLPDSDLRFHLVGGGEGWQTGIENQADVAVSGHTLSGDLSWEKSAGRGRTRMSAYYQDRGQTLDFRAEEGSTGSGDENFSHRERGVERVYGLTLDQAYAVSDRLRLQAGFSQRLLKDGAFRREYQGEAMFIPEADTSISYSMSIGPAPRTGSETAAYGEATWMADAWELYAGYRHFYERLSRNHGFGPRLGLTFAPAAGLTAKAALGVHTQAHENSDLSLRSDPRRARLPYMAQGSFGWGWRSKGGTEFTWEAFAKEGFHLARERMMLSGDGYSPVYVDTGRTRSRGWEVGARKPLAGRFSLSAAYSYLWHRERNVLGDWSPTQASIPHTFNVAGEYALLPGTFLGFRYALASGTPYTPFDSTASTLARAGVFSPAEAYGASGRVYARLDLRLALERRVGKTSFSAFAEIENVLDRRNDFERRWNPMKNGESVMKGMGRVPVLGVSLRF